jgi:hypothetical protein
MSVDPRRSAPTGRRVHRSLALAVFLLLLPTAASGSAAFERVDHVDIDDVFKIQSAVSDGTHAYFGTADLKVAKVRLSDMTVVGVISTEPPVQGRLATAVIVGGHAYFTEGSSRTSVVKVKLDGAACDAGVTCGGMRHVDTLQVDVGEGGDPTSIITDGTNIYLVFSSSAFVVRVIKIELSSFTRIGYIDLPAHVQRVAATIVDGEYAYLGGDNFSPAGRVEKVQLNGATCDAGVSCAGMAHVGGVAITPRILRNAVSMDNEHVYFGAAQPGTVVKLRKSDLSLVGTLGLGEFGEDVEPFVALVDGSHLYVGGTEFDDDTGWAAKVQLNGATCDAGLDCGGMAIVESFFLEDVVDVVEAGVSDGTFAYFGAHGSVDRVIRVRLGASSTGPEGDSGNDAGNTGPGGGPSTPVLADGEALDAPTGSAVWQLVDGSRVPLGLSSPAPNQVRYSSDGIRVTFTGGSGTSVTNGLVANPNGEIVCEVCSELPVGQVIEVWMFSTPRLVAAHLIGPGECQTFTIPLGTPLDGGGPVSAGAHTLQLALPTASGMQAVNVGVTVGGPVPASVPAGEGVVPTPGWLLALTLLALAGAVVAARRQVVAG